MKDGQIFINEKQFLNYYSKTFNRIIPLSFTNATPSMFFHWKKHKLISFGPSPSEKRTRVKLNLLEALWVKMLFKLRSFGLDVDSLKAIHAELFEDVRKDLIEQSKKQITNYIPVTDTKQLEDIFSALDNIEDEEPGFEILMTYFGMIASTVLYDKENIDILIYLDKESNALKTNLYAKQLAHKESVKAVKNQSYISVSMLELIYEVLEEDVFEPVLSDYELFDPKETTILNHLRNKNVKEITITRLNDEDYKIQITTTKDLKDDQVKELKKIFGLNNYKTVKLTTRNGKHIVIERTQIAYGKL
ncbi:MAG: hypothetical protein ACO1O6_13775 [Bacteroidota bacterium]